MRLTKLAPAIGAEVLDVDLARPMDEALFRGIERAWQEHSVLVFRGQRLDDLQQVAFAGRFGELAHTLKDYEHRWQVGDLVVWDNRCTLHARTDFPATHLRKLRRVAVKGERPVF